MWSDKTILKYIKNTCPGHIHIIKTEELTFHGFPRQPDYAEIKITVKPDEKAIELKSVKEYLKQFREEHLSYERLLNIIYDDFKEVYEPKSLKIVLNPKVRGGLESILIKEEMEKEIC